MKRRDDDLRPRPGRIRDGGPSGHRATRFVGEVLRAARKAGHTGSRFGTAGRGTPIGRGRFARSSAGLSRAARRVVVKARVVRHAGSRYRSAPLAGHIGYLQRDGVGQDGRNADLFGCVRDAIDGRDLVISRDYIAQGLRARAEELVGLERVPRSAREIASDTRRQVGADRWTDRPRV